MSQTIDWKTLGFNYQKTNALYVAYYKDGAWDEGYLTDDDRLHIPIGSPALHYGQQCFEGMKAYKTRKGTIQLFRPQLNAERMQQRGHRKRLPAY